MRSPSASDDSPVSDGSAVSNGPAGSDGSAGSRPWTQPFALAPLAAATLAVLAGARPALAVVAAAPTFLVVHRADPSAIALLLALACGVVPALAALVVMLLRSSGRRVATIGIPIWLGFLAATAVLPLLHRLPVAGAWAAGPMLGAVFGWCYPRRAALRFVVAALSPALVAVPLAFALDPGVRRATLRGTGAELEPVRARAPVVMVVLDEWSFGSLLDPDWVLAQAPGASDETRTWRDALDRERLPQLARFADVATWYVDARAISDVTEIAVPALLSGRVPIAGALPRLADHPDNLFTRLGGSYQVSALEPVTALCPSGLDRLARQTGGEDVAPERLLADTAVVWLHAILPPALRPRLPMIAQRWSGFLEDGAEAGTGAGAAEAPHVEAGEETERARAYGLWKSVGAADRVERFRHLLDSIEPGERQLYFVHLMLPHVPFEYLPSGARYLSPPARLPGLHQERWGADQRLADQALQRYLLQLGFVDRLLGELFDRLESAGLFDSAVVVLTSDHGASFRAGAARRMFEAANADDVVPVPLFVKLPGQREGSVRLEPVTALDVLPTVLEAIGLDPGPELHGRSLARLATAGGGEPSRGTVAAAPAPTTDRLFTKISGAVSLPDSATLGKARLTAARHQAELLASAGGDPFRMSQRMELLGRPLASIPVTVEQAGDAPSVALDGAKRWRAAAGGLAIAQGLLEGSLQGIGSLQLAQISCEIAITEAGAVAATAPLYQDAAGRLRFAALLPPELHGDEADGIDFYLVCGDGAPRALRLAGESARFDEAPAAGAPTAAVEAPAGEGGLLGFLDHTLVDGNLVKVAGWAIDRERGGPVDRVVLVLDGAPVAAGPPDTERGDVAREYGEPYRDAGFELSFALADPARLRRSGLRAVAVADGRTAPLRVFYQELVQTAGGATTVRVSDGREIVVGSSALEAWLETIDREALPPVTAAQSGSPPGGRVALVGWAADLTAGRRAERVVVFEHGRYVAQGWPGLAREDLAAALRRSELRDSGFVLYLDRPAVALRDRLRDGTVALVAVGFGGEAAFVRERPGLLDEIETATAATGGAYAPP